MPVLRVGVASQADACADEGAKMHGESVMHIAKQFHLRHKRYTVFIRKVVHHIIEAYMIHRELLRIQIAKNMKRDALLDHTINHVPLAYADPDLARRLVLPSTIMNYAKLLSTSSIAQQIEFQSFLLFSSIHQIFFFCTLIHTLRNTG